MVLMRGVQCRIMYNMLGRTIMDGCNNSIFLERKNEERKVFTMLWHQILGHIKEKGLQSLQGKGMAEGISN